MAIDIEGYTISIPHTVTTQDVCDLIITAFEGGSNYWIEKATLAHPDRAQLPELETPWYATRAFYETSGWRINITVSEDDPDKVYVLDRQSVEKALRVLAADYPSHAEDIINDNHDADTADAFMQCALFGEVQFG